MARFFEITNYGVVGDQETKTRGFVTGPYGYYLLLFSVI
jgi:hypothetical protein